MNNADTTKRRNLPSRVELEAKVAWLETMLSESNAAVDFMSTRLESALAANLRLREANRGLMKGIGRAQRRAALERALREGETN